MTRATLAVLVALAALPLAHANAPPSLSATASPAEAVLGQPVTFTDTSVDPDGSIERVVWTFTDGRSVEGASVVRAFDFPGLHLIGVSVTDDAGATVLGEVPVVVLATLMEGRATAVRAGDLRLADTGAVSTAQHEDHEDSVGEAEHGQLRAAGATSELRTLERRAVARADVAFVKVPLPIGYLLATGVEAEAIHGCGFPTIVNSKVAQVRLNDGQLPADLLPAGSRVPLPGGGSVGFNVQETTATGVVVTAIVVDVPGQPTVEIARAEAGVRHCPHAG